MDILQRYTNPSKYDIAKYGQLCKHGDQYFIQVSKNPDIANWLEIGDFLTVVFQESILSNDFISECLSKYESKTVNIEEISKQESII
jgi:hypothetical protein